MAKVTTEQKQNIEKAAQLLSKDIKTIKSVEVHENGARVTLKNGMPIAIPYECWFDGVTEEEHIKKHITAMAESLHKNDEPVKDNTVYHEKKLLTLTEDQLKVMKKRKTYKGENEAIVSAALASLKDGKTHYVKSTYAGFFIVDEFEAKMSGNRFYKIVGCDVYGVQPIYRR